MTLLISGIIGAAILISFLGFLAVWLKAPPLITIILIVVGLMFYDIYLEVRAARANNADKGL